MLLNGECKIETLCGNFYAASVNLNAHGASMNPTEAHVEVITNTDGEHLVWFQQALESALEIGIAVAFLKTSGLDLIWDELERALVRRTVVRVWCGLDFCLTSPEALERLHQLFQKHPLCHLRLCQGDSGTCFHPKVAYAIHTHGLATMLIGSANMTAGGLKHNTEVSAAIRTTLDSGLLQSVRTLLEALSIDALVATPIVLQRYRAQHQSYHRHAVTPTQLKKITQDELGDRWDTERFRTLLSGCRRSKETQWDIQIRRQNYQEASKILEQIRTTPINSPREFLAFYDRLACGNARLWSSGYLERSKTKVAACHIAFADLLNALHDLPETMTAEEVFQLAMPYRARIRGMGCNIMTEIIHTYAPHRFPVLNNNSRSSLLYLVDLDVPSPAQVHAADYGRFTDHMDQIRIAAGFEDFTALDAFFNYHVYWAHARQA